MTSLESALQKITPLVVDGNRYLPQTAVLQVASQLCYPAGSQPSAPHQQHLDEIAAALTALGYGDLVELAPPAVTAEQQGSYYQVLPPIDLETITRIVEAITPHALSIPYTGHDCRRLWKRVALTVWQTAYADLPPARQQFLASQVDAHMQALGWQWREGMEERTIPSGRAYLQQLVPDYEKMEEELADILTGSPVPAHQVMLTGLRGAFHYRVVSDPDKLIPNTKWRELLASFGYETRRRDDDMLHPEPLELPAGATERIQAAVAALPVQMTANGPALLQADLLAAVLPEVGIEADSVAAGQRQQLLADGPLGQALASRGFSRQPQWCQGHRFLPEREDGAWIFWRQARFHPDTIRLTLADGAPVYCPVAIIDQPKLIYLELLGPQELVKANWAALRNGGSSHTINDQWLRLQKAEKHQTLRHKLPIGWVHWCLIHAQACLELAIPGEPFYVLDPGHGALPPSFPYLLSRTLEIPTLPDWAPVLWQLGQAASVVVPLTEGCHGQSAWRVTSDPQRWQPLIAAGLQTGQFTLPA